MAAEPEEQANRFESEEQPAQAEMEDLGRTETAETAQAEHEETAQPEPEEVAHAESEEKQAPPHNRIELIIDSLPHHALTEPIPVTIESLGDSVFTASMVNVDIAATGNGIGEALLLLKEHIENTFDELNRQSAHLTSEQKRTLQMLHTFIPAQGKRSLWS